MNTNIPSDSRLCADCAKPIAAKRLVAVPTTNKCVRCQEAAGDVDTIKRYDEMVGEEVVSTFFTKPNPYLAMTLQRLAALGTCNSFSSGEYE